MMKSLTVVAFALILGGCQSTQPTLITTQNRVVPVPNEIISACPRAPVLPSAATLTEIQVADLLRRLYGNNSKCYQAMQEVKRLNTEAINTLEQR